jgi:hypothetical protein
MRVLRSRRIYATEKSQSSVLIRRRETIEELREVFRIGPMS